MSLWSPLQPIFQYLRYLSFRFPIKPISHTSLTYCCGSQMQINNSERARVRVGHWATKTYPRVRIRMRFKASSSSWHLQMGHLCPRWSNPGWWWRGLWRSTTPGWVFRSWGSKTEVSWGWGQSHGLPGWPGNWKVGKKGWDWVGPYPIRLNITAGNWPKKPENPDRIRRILNGRPRVKWVSTGPQIEVMLVIGKEFLTFDVGKNKNSDENELLDDL